MLDALFTGGAKPIRIESFTTPGVFYEMIELADGTWLCTCPSRQDPCKHVKSHLQTITMLEAYSSELPRRHTN